LTNSCSASKRRSTSKKSVGSAGSRAGSRDLRTGWFSHDRLPAQRTGLGCRG
jgi:hypothetical protein